MPINVEYSAGGAKEKRRDFTYFKKILKYEESTKRTGEYEGSIKEVREEYRRV
jgi:hypothetical protein